MTFKVKNTFSSNITIFTQFHDSPLGETECYQEDVVEANEEFEYTAYCMHNVPISIVDIWLTGDSVFSGDKAEVPECCHPSYDSTNPVVQYTFKLQCVNECVPTSAPVTSAPVTLTAAPTVAPVTDSPTGAPVSSPTAAPVTPTAAPVTDSPTGAPVSSPTAAPVTPTAAPVTDSPTGAPVSSPTAAPVTPTAAPVTDSPTGAPVSSPTAAPVTPTAAPVTPTAAPVTDSPTGAPVSVCVKTNDPCTVNSEETDGQVHEVPIVNGLNINLTDNSYSEWTLSLSNGIDMWTAGDSGKSLTSKAYVKYDCAAQTLCVLVKAEDGFTLDDDPDSSDNWIKIYTDESHSNSAKPGTIQQITEDDSSVIAWEGCFENIEPGCATDVQIHANYGGGETTSTGKKGSMIALDYQCECPRRLESVLAAETAGHATEPSMDAKDGHFCDSADYPCGEDGDDLVYVCHYSAKHGYQTFCVPEPDSDVLGFYPKDYCGPCVGGYGAHSQS